MTPRGSLAALPGRFHAGHGVPAGAGWMPAAEYVGASFLRIVSARAEALRTDRLGVAASLVMQNYASHVIAPPLAAAVVQHRLVDASLDNVWLRLNARGAVHSVAFTREAPASLADGMDVGERRLWVHRRLVSENLAFAVQAMRAQVRVSSRTLWGNIASATAATFRMMDWAGPEHAVTPQEAADWLALDPRTADACDFLQLTRDGRDWLIFRRRTCCLQYQVPDGGYCTPCSLLSESECRERFERSLRHNKPPVC